MRVSDLINMGMEWGIYAMIPVAVLGTVFLVGYHLIYKKICKGTKTITLPQMLLYGMFACYVIVVFGVTLLNRYAYQTELFRLMPFYSYMEAWHQYKDSDWRNIILNIFMLVPFGLLLPYLHRIFRKFGPTLTAGFVFTLCIEVSQLVLRRGIFEADDLINNTLGTVIGYGLFRLADYLHHKYKKEPAKLSPVLLYQLPLLVASVAFIMIFSIHDLKELGNLRCHHIIKAHPESVICNAEFDEAPDTAYVYIVPIVTVEETLKYAEEFFGRFGSGIDESRTDIYDETAVYYNDDNSLSLWIDYEGNKINFTDFGSLYGDDAVKPMENAPEEEIRQSLDTLGFYIPEAAAFSVSGRGNYMFDSACVLIGEEMYDGKVRCSYGVGGVILDLDYNIIKGTPYKEFPIISEEEAYTRIAQGFFRFEPAYEPENIIVNDIFLAYEVDSKGFYQPIYILECHIDGKDTRLYTPAIR